MQINDNPGPGMTVITVAKTTNKPATKPAITKKPNVEIANRKIQAESNTKANNNNDEHRVNAQTITDRIAAFEPVIASPSKVANRVEGKLPPPPAPPIEGKQKPAIVKREGAPPPKPAIAKREGVPLPTTTAVQDPSKPPPKQAPPSLLWGKVSTNTDAN